MSMSDDIKWFHAQFGDATRKAIDGTPFSLDLVTAIGVQETQEVWGRARLTHPVDEVLKLCVGDTIDASGGRGAWPRDATQLRAAKNGGAMFQIAHQALLDMSTVAPEYKRIAANPNKFAHAYGIFQYDIQSFLEDPDFFMQKQWYNFDACLAKCLMELEQKRRHTFGTRTDLSPTDLVYVAIAYNKDSAHVGAGFKQGFKSGGKFYGELVWEYMQLSAQIAAPGNTSTGA